MVPCCCCSYCYWRADGRRLYRTKLFCQRECLTVFPSYCCPERWLGMNRISHPDWVKLCIELNYAPNKNTKILFCYNIKKFTEFILLSHECISLKYFETYTIKSKIRKIFLKKYTPKKLFRNRQMSFIMNSRQNNCFSFCEKP